MVEDEEKKKEKDGNANTTILKRKQLKMYFLVVQNIVNKFKISVAEHYLSTQLAQAVDELGPGSTDWEASLLMPMRFKKDLAQFEVNLTGPPFS